MKLLITQCKVGRYNVCNPNEETFNFYMGIYEGNNLVRIDGVPAQLHYEGEPEEIDNFRDALENLRDVFEACFKYCDRIWSSVPYLKQCMTFAKVYNDNFDAINAEMTKDRLDAISKKVAELEREAADLMGGEHIVPPMSSTTDRVILDRIKTLTNWCVKVQKELEEIKPETKSYEDKEKLLNGYKEKIEQAPKFLSTSEQPV